MNESPWLAVMVLLGLFLVAAGVMKINADIGVG